MDTKIVDTLNELARKGGGVLTPDVVVAEAKKKSSPLHHYFESRGCWDAKTAQAAWCVSVARELIRSVRVEVTNTIFSVKAPAFVRDPSQAPRQGYASLSRLRSDKDLAHEVLVREFSMASAALARAQAVAAALDMSDEIEDIKSRINAMAERASAHAN